MVNTTTMNAGSILSKYYKGEKHRDVNMGDILIKFMTKDSINKIEGQK